jgi:D-alanine-D-alanine ligase
MQLSKKMKKMKKIGLVYDTKNNPYVDHSIEEYPDIISEYVYPSEIDAICQALRAIGYQFEIIDGAHGLLDCMIKKQRFDLIFNKSIGFKGLERKIAVPSICQMFNLPCVGSGAYSMTLARHKYHTNRLLHGLGFRVPFAHLYTSGDLIPQIATYPVIIKLNDESASLGISEKSVCNSIEELKSAIKELQKNFNSPYIIEEFIPGEEWKVAVIGNKENTCACGCVNTIKNGKTMVNTLQTRSDMLSEGIFSFVPIKHPLKEEALYMAEKIHRAMELNDYSRCDFRIGPDGNLYCMEVSTHPEISKESSSFMDAAIQKYRDYNTVISNILLAAERRYEIV